MSDGGNVSGTEETSESEQARPNRWNGPASTWYTLTEQERGLAASLDELRNRDLSIHLFNAHALKRRAREIQRGVQPRGDLLLDVDTDEVGRNFVPPRIWTAWPLPPDEVPREGEIIGPDNPDDAYTYKSRQAVMPSWPLEENLLAITLRFAKERFEARQWTEESFEEEPNKDQGQSALGAESTVQPSRSQLDSGPSDHNNNPTSRSSVENKSRHSESAQRHSSRGSKSPYYRYKSVSPRVHQPAMRPVVSTDDERSHRLLRPSIRHTLTKLDEVLMALHHARKLCHQYASRPEANSEDDTIEDRSPPKKRPRGRPRKLASLPERSEDTETGLDRIDNPDLLAGKKVRRGRPRKNYERLEGETQEEYLVRVARIQKKAMPAFALPRQMQTPEATQQPHKDFRATKSPMKNTALESRRAARRRNLGTRDWSEVMGVAAIVGLSPQVIARATQRCATLFSESMAMRTIVEAPFSEKESDYVTLYQPEEVPALDPLSQSSPEPSSSESNSSVPLKHERGRSASRPVPENHAHLHSWLCPINGCPVRNRGLRFISHLKRHLRRVHKLSEEEIDGYFPDSDEEMNGAVHVDGFLRPIKNRKGQRGKDIVKSKSRGRSRRTQSSAGVHEVEAMSKSSDEEEQVGYDETKVESRSSSSSL